MIAPKYHSLVRMLAVFLLVALSLVGNIAYAAFPIESSIILKGGSIKLDESSQTLEDDVTRTFDSNSNQTYAIAWELRVPTGKSSAHFVAAGLEYVRYHHDFKPSTGGGTEADAFIYVVGAKYYYMQPGSAWHPFVGGGIGYGESKVPTNRYGYNHTIYDSSTAYHFTAGVEYRPKSIGVVAEIKHIENSSNDSTSRDFDASGWGLFLGLTMRLVGP